MSTSPSLEAPLRGVHVLLVEDHEDLRESLCLVLEGAGARVTPAAPSHVARAVLGEGLPDVAIVACGFPPDDDTLAFLAVAALVTERRFGIITLCSTRQRTPHRVDASLLKPVAAGDLVDTVLVTAHRRREPLRGFDGS